MEEEFLELIDQYFIEIIKSKSQEDSTFIFESFLNLRFYDKEKILRTTSDFQLVKSNDLYPIFIEIDNEGKGIWEKYIEITNNDKLKPWEKKIKIYEFKNDFENYIVSIRLNDKNYKIFDIDSEGFLGHVKKCELDKYYDFETGFKKQEGIELIW
jgi:CRISPR-associated endonuclease/helicase Cas3